MKSSASRITAQAGTLLLSLLIASCGGSGAGGDTAPPATPPAVNPINFQTVDHNNAGVPGVDAYDGATLVGTTDATGAVSLDLPGVHTVHFVKSGYPGQSRFDRDWTGVTATQIIAMVPNPGGATVGTVQGNITVTGVADSMLVTARRNQDGFRSPFYSPVEAATTTAYSLLSALEGNSDLFVVPSTINFPAVSSFAGYNPGVAVSSTAAATVNPSLVRSAATTLNVSATGGFPAGSIRAFYGVSGNPFAIGRDLFDVFPAFTGGGTLASQVNVAPVNLIAGLNAAHPAMSYRLTVIAYATAGGPTATGNDQTRQETRIFPSFADLTAAAVIPQGITLENDGVGGNSPVNNATQVSLQPTFSWTRTGTPDYMDLRLNEYVPVPPGGPNPSFYVKLVWLARVYGSASSVTYPTVYPPLNASSFYAYELYARRDRFNSAGTFTGFRRNGLEMVKFSPSPNPPP